MCLGPLQVECKKPHLPISNSSKDIQFLSFTVSFQLVLSFMTFLFEYTFICSNNLHSKILVSFGNQIWPQQTEMSHYLPVLPKVLVFLFFQLFVNIGRFVSEIYDFMVPERSIVSKRNKFCHFCHFTVISNSWNDKILNLFKYSPITVISPSIYTGDIFLPKLTQKILKCHQNVLFLQCPG